jgi:hypothetical protein
VIAFWVGVTGKALVCLIGAWMGMTFDARLMPHFSKNGLIA